MTTAVEAVSAEIRRYIAAVGGDPSRVPAPFDALADYVIGGLQPGETVLRVVCLRTPRPDWTTAAGLAVLTDRGILIAEEGPYGRRLSLWDIFKTGQTVAEYGGDRYPALDLFANRTPDRIVAAPVDGWNVDLAHAELSAFGSAVLSAAAKAKQQPRPVGDRPVGAPTAAVGAAPDGQPARQRPKPHYIAATFYAIIAFVGLIVAVQGQPAALLGTLLAGLYSVYLYRGGRWVIFFF